MFSTIRRRANLLERPFDYDTLRSLEGIVVRARATSMDPSP